ncbi:hypothetical protein PSP6_680059 [Paraburkholderia tropica]|nr:hypothetical protein PSP6_680059 [Paraburkholderia tropica]
MSRRKKKPASQEPVFLCPRDVRTKRTNRTGKKKPAMFGGLNPYQRRHGGDKVKYSELLGATQHVK